MSDRPTVRLRQLASLGWAPRHAQQWCRREHSRAGFLQDHGAAVLGSAGDQRRGPSSSIPSTTAS